MEDSKKTTGMIVGVIVAILIVAGIFWAVGGNDQETAKESNTNTTQSQSADNNDQATSEPANIVGLASATADLSTLVAAVQAADLVETLSGEGPFTVFAPTNAAFSALPAGTLDSLLLPENKEKLAGILTYHVVSGKVMSSDLSDGQEITTVQGGKLTVKISEGSVYLVDATGAESKVETADVEASNGVVHIIGGVVLPE